jgi:Flp pilus assembly protein TadG
MGQALLELALVMPFLLLLLIGAIEFGIVAYGSIEVSNAAAAGAAYGAQNHANAADNTGITNAAKNDAANLATLNVTGVTQWCACEGGTAVSVGANGVHCSGFAAASCVSPSRVVEWVQVDTSSTIDPLFHYPGIPSSVTLLGHATMRVGQ